MTLLECQPGDAEAISKLASEIWPRVYSEMISVKQIDFMLNWMYAPEKIREDMGRGVKYFYIQTADDETAGYCACGPDSEDPGTWLHKLYISPDFQRQGLASAALAEICKRLEDGKSISLRVNRGNEAAIALYRKMGFVITEERCSKIGGGFVMDDFIMRMNQ